MNRFQIIAKYWQNKRLKIYEEILKKAIDKGYIITSLRDFLEIDNKQEKKILILRHDIDFASKGTEKMFFLEKKYSVKASYYFRKSTMNLTLMDLIQQYGSEVSFHFETVSDYILENNFQSREEFRKSNWKEDCFNNLKKDLEFFRAKRYSCRTIAGHGHPLCRKFKAANYFLTYEPKSYEYLDIALEAYNQEFINEIDSYVSDCQYQVNDGWFYGKNALEALEEEPNLMLFLTHPHHWYFNIKYKLKQTVKNLLKKPIYQEKEFDLF